jgi:flagellar protein FliJ
MKKFKFKLQRLLDIREAKEKEIQNELAALLHIQNLERIRQNDYRRKISEEHEKFASRIKGGKFSYSESLMFERFIAFAHRVIEVAQEMIEEMEPEIQKVRDRLIEASKEKKVVERLKKKKWNEFMYEYNREMANEYDDANQKLFLNKRIEQAQGQ